MLVTTTLYLAQYAVESNIAMHMAERFCIGAIQHVRVRRVMVGASSSCM